MERARKQHSGRKDSLSKGGQARWNRTSLTSGKLSCIYEVCVVWIGSVWDVSSTDRVFMVCVYYRLYEVYTMYKCIGYVVYKTWHA